MPTCTHINFHLEAQRKQRAIERQNAALIRIQQAKVSLRFLLYQFHITSLKNYLARLTMMDIFLLLKRFIYLKL